MAGGLTLCWSWGSSSCPSEATCNPTPHLEVFSFKNQKKYPDSLL